MKANAVRAERNNVVEDVTSVLMSTRQWVMGSISEIYCRFGDGERCYVGASASKNSWSP